MDRPYDGQVENSQMRDARMDRSAGQNLASEASSLLNNSSLANRVANCEAAGLSFTHVTNRLESPQSNSAMDVLVMGGLLEASGRRGGLTAAAFVNSMLDTGGNKVSLDVATGKLLTTDSGGRTIDYDMKLAGEQSSQRNASIIPTLFLGSPFALLGMGATMAMGEQVQANSHGQEVNRLKSHLAGSQAGSVEQQQVQQNEHRQPSQQNIVRPKGYVSDVASMQNLVQDKKLQSSTSDIYSLSGLAPELFPNQRMVERNNRVREGERKQAKRIEMDKMVGIERKRQQMRVKLSVDRSNLTVANLSKRKLELENEIELSRGKASLAEASKMHSELELLDKAITRLSRLGM